MMTIINNAKFKILYTFILAFLAVTFTVSPTLANELGKNYIHKVSKELGIAKDRLAFLEFNQFSGWSVVMVDNKEYVFITNDMKYIASGMVKDIDKGILIQNLLEEKRREPRRELLKEIDNTLIIYPAIGEEKSSITVFVDTDDIFSKRIHGEIETLNKSGVTVKYAAFIREAANEDLRYSDKVPFSKMAAVWSIKDTGKRQKAMNHAMHDEHIDAKTSKEAVSLIRRHMDYAYKIGVSGVPFIIFENGAVTLGYDKAEDLVKKIKQAGAWKS